MARLGLYPAIHVTNVHQQQENNFGNEINLGVCFSLVYLFPVYNTHMVLYWFCITHEMSTMQTVTLVGFALKLLKLIQP